MKELVIVGAGNAAREVLQIAKDINRAEKTWEIKGFVADSGLDIKALTNGDYDIIGTIDEWEPNENEVFTCAIADPNGREHVVNKLIKRGATFIQMIHPKVHINDYCTIGEGVILYPTASIGPNALVGNFVFSQSVITHDCVVGPFSTISGGARLTGGTKVGERVFVGSNATIIPGRTIGDDAFISAGSVVIRNVKPGTKVFGNPARRIDI